MKKNIKTNPSHISLTEIPGAQFPFVKKCQQICDCYCNCERPELMIRDQDDLSEILRKPISVMLDDSNVQVTFYCRSNKTGREKKIIFVTNMAKFVKTKPLSKDNMCIIEYMMDLLVLMDVCVCGKNRLIDGCESVVNPLLSKVATLTDSLKKRQKIYVRLSKAIDDCTFRIVKENMLGGDIVRKIKTTRELPQASIKQNIMNELKNRIPQSLQNNKLLLSQLPDMSEQIYNTIAAYGKAGTERIDGISIMPHSSAAAPRLLVKKLDISSNKKTQLIGSSGSSDSESDSGSSTEAANKCSCPKCRDKTAYLLHQSKFNIAMKMVNSIVKMPITRKERDSKILEILSSSGYGDMFDSCIHIIHDSDKAADSLIKEVEEEQKPKKKKANKKKKKNIKQISVEKTPEPIDPSVIPKKKKGNRAERRALMPKKEQVEKTEGTDQPAQPAQPNLTLTSSLQTLPSDLLDTLRDDICDSPIESEIESEGNSDINAEFDLNTEFDFGVGSDAEGSESDLAAPPGLDVPTVPVPTLPVSTQSFAPYYLFSNNPFMFNKWGLGMNEFNALINISTEQSQVESYFSTYTNPSLWQSVRLKQNQSNKS